MNKINGASCSLGREPFALKDEIGRKQIERVINTAGYNYWLACDECLKVCPLNKNSC